MTCGGSEAFLSRTEPRQPGGLRLTKPFPAASIEFRAHIDAPPTRPPRRELSSLDRQQRVLPLQIQAGHIGCPQKNSWTLCFVRVNLIKYGLIFKHFTVRIRRKFAIIMSLKISPHLKCVATLPCEMSVS